MFRDDGGRPCVVQIRLGGSKGLLVLMSEEQEKLYLGKDVILRESMVKALPSPEHANDPSLWTLDIVRAGLLRIGGALNSEAIVAINHGGVPIPVFTDMAKRGLEDLEAAFDPQAKEDESRVDVLKRLSSACYSEGGVRSQRKQRDWFAEGKSMRALGITTRSDNVDYDLGGDGLIHEIERFDIDPITGQSGSLAER